MEFQDSGDGDTRRETPTCYVADSMFTPLENECPGILFFRVDVRTICFSASRCSRRICLALSTG